MCLLVFSPCKTSCWWRNPVWCCCWAARNWSWFHPHRHPPHQNSYCWIFLRRQEGGRVQRESKCQTFPPRKLILPICSHIHSQPCGIWPKRIFCNFPGHFIAFMTLVSCVFKSYHTPQMWQWCRGPSYNVIHSAVRKAAGQTRSLVLLWRFNPKAHLKETGYVKIYTTSTSTTCFVVRSLKPLS